VSVSFPLHFKGGETARIAVSSLLCPGVSVEVFLIFFGRAGEQLGSPKAPELANSQSRNDAVAGVSLEGFGMNSYHGCRLLAIQQRLEDYGRTGGIEHGSYTP
jgi:hypothetical protein